MVLNPQILGWAASGKALGVKSLSILLLLTSDEGTSQKLFFFYINMKTKCSVKMYYICILVKQFNLNISIDLCIILETHVCKIHVKK